MGDDAYYSSQTNHRHLLSQPADSNPSPCKTRRRNHPSIVQKSTTNDSTKEITPNWELKRPTNTPCEVLITNCASPWKLFLQYCHYEDKLNTLMEDIQISAIYANPVETLMQGLICLALYRDGRWYRVKILTVGRTISIRLMDYGWGWQVSKEDKNKRFRIIENRFLPRKIPFFAFDVKLYGITPTKKNLGNFRQENAWWCKLKLGCSNAKKFLMEIVEEVDAKSVILMTLDGKNVIASTFQEGEIASTNR